MREIFVNVTPRETRAVLVENGSAQELYIERASRRGLVGNFYKGRVSRVLPGMQAAFVDIGLARTAFLHAGDFARAAPADSDSPAPAVADIASLVLPGQDLLVQVLKDPLGTKGARLSTVVSLPSRFLVYMPFGRGIGVSARIDDRRAASSCATWCATWLTASRRPPACPPAAVAVTSCAPRHSAHRPKRCTPTCCTSRACGNTCARSSCGSSSGTLVHADLPLGARMLRDELSPEVRRVLVDDAEEFARLRQFAGAFMPEAVDRIEHYSGARPLFELHGVEEEISRALDRQVQLKSGGYIVIDQTESMTTVDVNTGGFVGSAIPRIRCFAPTSRPR